jgi:hypothetical protein
MFVFSDFVPSPEDRYTMGNVLIALVVMSMIVNFLYLNRPSINPWYPKLRKLYHNAVRRHRLSLRHARNRSLIAKISQAEPEPPKAMEMAIWPKDDLLK